MFQARSTTTSPSPTCLPSTEAMLARVIFFCTNWTPFLVHGASASRRSSKSITVTFFGLTFMCLKRMGRVHWATAP